MSIAEFDRVLVPLSSERDAAGTATALGPLLAESDAEIYAVHVIEKAGGAPDKASVAQRELVAEDVFGTFVEELEEADRVLESGVRYGTDVAATIVRAAREVDADAIVFTPRGGSRWQKLLTGDVTLNLVAESDLPILILPDPSGTID